MSINDSNITVVDFRQSPNQRLIDNLKEILRYAESGELQCFVSTGVLTNNHILTTRIIEDDTNLFLLLGAVTNLQLRIAEEIE